jgi:hypothetical protein
MSSVGSFKPSSHFYSLTDTFQLSDILKEDELLISSGINQKMNKVSKEVLSEASKSIPSQISVMPLKIDGSEKRLFSKTSFCLDFSSSQNIIQPANPAKVNLFKEALFQENEIESFQGAHAGDDNLESLFLKRSEKKRIFSIMDPANVVDTPSSNQEDNAPILVKSKDISSSSKFLSSEVLLPLTSSEFFPYNSFKKVPPLKPFKKVANFSEIAKEYLEINASLKKGSFVYFDHKCFVSFLGSGHFSNCYRINTPAIFSNYVVKAFKDERVERNISNLKGYLEKQLENYGKCNFLKINTARILNIETAKSDKFIIVQFIKDAIEVLDWQNKEIPELSEKELKILISVRDILEKAFKNRLSLDLLPDNLRLGDDLSVFVTDFGEIDYDEDEFFLEMSKRLVKWSSTLSIQEFLICNLEKEFKEMHLTNFVSAKTSFNLSQ